MTEGQKKRITAIVRKASREIAAELSLHPPSIDHIDMVWTPNERRQDVSFAVWGRHEHCAFRCDTETHTSFDTVTDVPKKKRRAKRKP